MRKLILVLFLLFAVAMSVAARNVPDSIAVTKLYSTSWTFTSKYRFVGVFKRRQKIEDPSDSLLTIYANEIHTQLKGGKYQICAARHRNSNEFWVDCAVNREFIYRVMRIAETELVIDVWSRPIGRKEYIRTSRNYYARSKS